MRIRRPIATLLTVTALFTGGATLTACGAGGESGVTENSEDDGDDGGDDEGGEDEDD